MGWLSPGRRAVGLELDTNEVRAVELRGDARAPRLARLARAPLPAGAVADGMVAQPGVVAAALREVWSEAGFSTRDVVLGVANQGVLVRFAALPRVAANKIDQVLRYQAQDYLPVPLSTVVLDYAVTGELTGEAGPQLEVLLVAARRDMLDAFLETLEAARLKPRDIDVVSLALLRLLPSGGEKEAVAVVNVAHGLSSILVAAGGIPRLARLIPLGLKDAAEAPGSLPEPPGEPPLSWRESLAGEIRSSISYYQGQAGAAPVGSVILSGRGARAEGLAAWLQSSLGLPVTVAGLPPNIIVPPGLAGEAGRFAADFVVCVSLARRGLEVRA